MQQKEEAIYLQLCIGAANKIKQVAALVGMLGGGVWASWCDDQVQAQRAQHEPCHALLRLLLQQLPVRAALLWGHASM